MIIDCISDLHGFYPDLEGGDLLIVAGDFCNDAQCSAEQLEFLSWLQNQKYTKSIFVAGNHDTWLERVTHNFDMLKGIEYLCDSGTEFEGLKIWGSPWTKTFPGMNPHCKAFTLDTDEKLAERWALIPDDIDILVTHSPPINIFDGIKNYMNGRIEHVGSESLLMRATQLENLKLFVFGHIHEGYGIYKPEKLKDFASKSPFGPAKCKSFPYLVNASHVNECFDPVNKPIRIEL